MTLGREEIARAAELHDIGKLAIPPEILARPGPLAGACAGTQFDPRVVRAFCVTRGSAPIAV